MGYAIETRDLVKKFGDFTAVNHLNLRIRKGEIYALLGPNGAGKTTTVRMIMGLLKPTSGEIFVDGISVVKYPEIAKKKIGYVPQFFSLYADLTVYENLDFYGRIYGLSREERVKRIRELLEIVELSAYKDFLAGNLSGGMKRRLSLAAALIHDPPILILDEPTAGVDPPLRRAFWRLFVDLKKEGKTILVTTHYMDEAEKADRIGLISRGKLVAEGTPRDIKRMVYGGDVVRIVFRSYDTVYRSIKELPTVMKIIDHKVIDKAREEIIVVVKDFGTSLPEITDFLKSSGAEPLLIEPVPVTLEDAFIALATRAKNV
ncbi:MAG: ABC transporter ATP-binding protein [Candidatus Njordarchaeales archaeon]